MTRSPVLSSTLWPIAQSSAAACLLSYLGSVIYTQLHLQSPASDYEILVVLWSLAGAAIGAAMAGIAKEQNWRSRFFVLVTTPLFALVLLRTVTALFAPVFMSHIFVALAVLILISTLAGVSSRALSRYW